MISESDQVFQQGSAANSRQTRAEQLEQRRAERVKVAMKVSLQAENPVNRGNVVGPAIVHDISLLGAYMTTRHDLRPGQEIDIRIPTDACPQHMGLPGYLTGRAIVRRVHAAGDRSRRVAMSFMPSLAQSMEFAFFMAYLLGLHADAAAAF